MTSSKVILLFGVLPLLLLLLIALTQIQVTEAAFKPGNKFTNYSTKGAKPKNQSCYECADVGLPDADIKRGRCDEFRDLWRKFVRAKDAHKGRKSDYRNELLAIMKQKFGKKCQYGVEDCFFARPEDKRIVGYETRGCGPGELVMDAEPGEGCATEKLSFPTSISKINMVNCVCDESEGTEKGYCNTASRQSDIGSSFGILMAIGTLILLQPLVEGNF